MGGFLLCRKYASAHLLFPSEMYKKVIADYFRTVSYIE